MFTVSTNRQILRHLVYTSVLIESLCIKDDWIDDTIEIRIIILVEIFVGIKKHSEKKNTGSMNIKIQMTPLPRPSEMSAVRSESEITNLSFFQKKKKESKLSPINGIIRENYRKQILF